MGAGYKQARAHRESIALPGHQAAARAVDVCQRDGHGGENVGTGDHIAFAKG